jgi:DedD protein
MRTIQEIEEQDQTDTEITLGMKSLLGIFFGLVLICGVFFGLGYSLGRGGSASKSASEPAPESAKKIVTAKPMPPASSTSSLGEDDTANPTYTPGPDDREAESATISKAAAPPKPSASVIKQVTSEPVSETSPAPSKPTAAIASAQITATAASSPSSSAAPAAAQTGTAAMVQIAAISRQEDADVLVAALKKHGYNAVVRDDPKDNLLHVQVGPFATRDEARAMRAKLMADGYNAILK